MNSRQLIKQQLYNELLNPNVDVNYLKYLQQLDIYVIQVRIWQNVNKANEYSLALTGRPLS